MLSARSNAPRPRSTTDAGSAGLFNATISPMNLITIPSILSSALRTACSLTLVAVGWTSIVAGGVLAAGFATAGQTPAQTPMVIARASSTDTTDTTVDGEAWGPLQLVVYKGKRTLLVYREGVFYKQYPIVLGFKPDGRKRFAHDARTPEGYYRIIDKRPHNRWGYFMAIDYPNERDRFIYKAEVQQGLVPVENGRPFSIGSGLGLHGTDKPGKQAAGINWTKGCVALSNDAISELYEMVEVGTPIWLLE
ncbi:MAG: hypothetical protein ACI8TX_000241 [Hyphomicrobiaceae bacterium]|jgi:hypothetical protein